MGQKCLCSKLHHWLIHGNVNLEQKLNVEQIKIHDRILSVISDPSKTKPYIYKQ